MLKRKHTFSNRFSRTGLTKSGVFEKSPDDLSARKWFESILWEDGRYCGHCGSARTKGVPIEKPMPFWCSDCRSYFSIQIGTPIQSSKIPLRKWAMAIYMMTASLKGASSMKIHRELGISQSCAWHMIHRIRKTWNQDCLDRMTCTVEVEETYISGKERNRHTSKKFNIDQGTVGKTAVAGI